MSRTRVAVIGVGYFGQNHARNLAAMRDVELVAVVDRDQARAEEIAQAVGTVALPSADSILHQVDAVCICVPTTAHAKVAAPFLRRGIATLIEKPLALSPDEARQIVEMAKQHHAIVQVGHVERFNPAWTAVENCSLHPQFIEARRHSPYPFRSLDVSVVFDIMIHDLDLTLSAVGATVVGVEATGTRVLSLYPDRAEVRLQFANGCQAVLSASRVSNQSIRAMRLWTSEMELEVDFLNRTSQITRTLDPTPRSYSPGLSREEKETLLRGLFETKRTQHNPQAQPLRDELMDFVRCVRDQDIPKVTGEHAYAAVVLAAEIDRVIAADTPIRQAA